MGEIQKKTNVQEDLLGIYYPSTGTKAIETRRKMMWLVDNAETLSPIEKDIFRASTDTLISDIGYEEFVARLKALIRCIVIDVGITAQQKMEDWQYMHTRALDILKKYYSDLTLADVKKAFELVVIGELDYFLPKDKYGHPDKNHYQQFNLEYISKTLNAYRRKQDTVIGKAYKELQKQCPRQAPRQMRLIEEQRGKRNRHIFLLYKYTGKFMSILTDDIFLYEWLRKYGLTDNVQVKEQDREKAYVKYMAHATNGMISQYMVSQVKREGIGSHELDVMAFEVARRNNIIKAFDRMVAGEMQVDDYLKY